MKRLLAVFSLVIFGLTSIILINGCATIFGWSGAEQLNIKSTPDQADITIDDEVGTTIFEGKTPTLVSLEKKKGYFSGKSYTLKISKEGYETKLYTIDTKANGWYIAGNIVFGGLIGWIIVDPLTGAMWTLDTNDINATLTSTNEGTWPNNNETKILLLQDVPDSMRDKMIRVAN